ncbi:uncharacterized protein LOC130568741 isoform X2 [Triplophysa rosa]|uniref:uncharacterized protein LOC130568741 isoform X2 n=1 Tax=Triplophysa rosa TaxID=992332 RepID=UPI002545C358|nr:uncharacterized protein LOC130568741 isoform X2 [Triplophysa rosa]
MSAALFKMEEAPKILVTVLLDGTEICKKLFQLRSAAEIIDTCKRLLPRAAEYKRILQFNADFNEFIDIDLGDNIQNLDKFQVLFKSIKGGQLTANAEGASHQQNVCSCSCNILKVAPRNTQKAARSSQEKHPCEPIDVDTLKALIERKSPSILSDYEASGMLSEISRKRLVKIAVGGLVERSGFYPSSDEKLMLAKSVVTLFPSLKIKMGDTNEGFEHFYDPVSHSGFIEIKLRNLRRNLHDDQRRYHRKRCRMSDTTKESISLEMSAEEEESTQVWTTVIKWMKPSPENLTTIKVGMEKTYTSRRLWIANKSLTVNEIFEQYPRFADMPYLLDTEFEKMFPGKGELFLLKWEGNIVPKLLKMSSMKDLAVFAACNSNDESCYRALQMLTELLPPTASGRGKGWAKCSVKSAITYLLDIKQTGTSLQDHSQRIVENHQPHLVCLGSPSTTAQYIIVADNDKVTIPLEDNNMTCAIDKLFKLYWVCNLTYPLQLTSVFNFFENVYEMPLSSGRRSKVVELIAKLQALI